MRWLGSVTCSSGYNSNNRTGPSGLSTFTLGTGVAQPLVKELWLQSSQSGVFFELGSSGATCADTRGAILNGTLQGPFRVTADMPAAHFYCTVNTASTFVSVRIFESPRR